MNKHHVPIGGVVTVLLLVTGFAYAQGPSPEHEMKPQSPLRAGFTYQGQLSDENGPVDDTCDLSFQLDDMAGGGALVGPSSGQLATTASTGTDSVPANPSASQATVTLNADADATVRSWEPDANFGDEHSLELSAEVVDEETTLEAVTLLRFDLSSLPPDAVIDSASLRLFLEASSGADPVSIAAYLVASSWDESTITWNTPFTIGSVGLGASVDGVPGSYKAWSISSFAQSWIDNPGANHGVMLRGPTDGTTYERWFASRDSLELVPQLDLTYHVPTYVLSGRVYEGDVGDQTTPLEGVAMTLYCSNDAGVLGSEIDATTTDATGWYGLDTTLGCEYYHVVEADPEGYISVDATTVDGGVRSPNWIEYVAPLGGKTLTGNKFWDRLKPPPSTSAFPSSPPVVDGVAAAGEWDHAPSLDLQHGKLHFQNDAANLYLLVDVTADTHADPPLADAPWGDYLWLSFDVDLDSAITPNADLNYALYPGTHTLGVQEYLGPGQWTGLFDTFSRLGAGFGASFNETTPHRIWELAISLSEIEAAPNELVRLGLRTYSQTPNFSDDHPKAFTYDFTSLIEIALADGQADLLVLADEDFLSALEPLKTHKEDTGIPTYVQSWQSLDLSLGGDGRDEPERLKKAVAAYEQCCDTRWVMLVGDVDRFPVRTVKAINLWRGSMYYSSDLYYADLYDQAGSFDDWDSDGDDVFGEMDFAGYSEHDVNKLNLDNIDMYPDVRVGRIPASTVDEVSTYVSKVISYEFDAYEASWFKNALWTVDGDWGRDVKKDRLDGYMDGFTIHKRYGDHAPWNSDSMDLSQRAAELNKLMNSGVGFVNWFGHGQVKLWSGWYDASQFSGLSNGDKLPVIYAVSCLTGRYIWSGCDQRSEDYYRAIDGSEWHYTACSTPVDRPQPDPVQPKKYDRESLAEEFLVKRDSGAVAYIGATSVHEFGGEDLDKYFFEAYSVGWKPPTLGYLWTYALREWLDNVPMWDYYAFHHMHKVTLFGDPSLRVGGVPRIQKSDVAATYNIVHDGWEGRLELNAAPDVYIEQLPNLTGVYTDTTEQIHGVRGYMRTWRYPMPSDWGPDHKVEFHIDFPDTPQAGDDQRFDGYLFTRTGNAMAGVTWWQDTPFGFYAIKDGSGASAFRFETAATDLVKDDFTGVYQMNHDGWKGTLVLRSVEGDYIEQLPNIEGTYTGQDGKSYAVRGYVRTPSYPLPEEFGPDHLILLNLDFNNTPTWDDDTEFEGYLFTQTKDAIAGVGSLHDTPYGFYALKTGEVPEARVHLPLVIR